MIETEKNLKRDTTTIQLSEKEREMIDEYAKLSGMESMGKVIRHFTIPAVEYELPALRERHRRRMETLGTL